MIDASTILKSAGCLVLLAVWLIKSGNDGFARLVLFVVVAIVAVAGMLSLVASAITGAVQ